MALQNRVTPRGDIIAHPARGTFMGNRGIIHEPKRKVLLTRRWQHQAWICCVLKFKDFQHPIMGESAYTELFFLDEATALAAGHRPCAYCRRPAYNAFKAAWVAANLGANPGTNHSAFVPVADMDRQLHRERVTRQRQQIHFEAPIESLPDGAYILREQLPALVHGNQLLPWSAHGYTTPQARPLCGNVTVLTPRSIVAALREGYRCNVHATALE
ncbi:MAG: hypothetical protein ACR2RL_13490 [Gammaproteobacteria bacterium]